MSNSPLVFSSPDEKRGNEFIDKAIRLVREEIQSQDEYWPMSSGLEEPVTIYIVWFSKTLQNWKALVSTDIPDGRYYEVTYNGDKEEAYVDTYTKVRNTRRSDNEDNDG